MTLHTEKLPEGVWLATSDDVPGLVVQGRMIEETTEIAHDIAKKLMEMRRGVARARLPSPNPHPL